MPVVNHREEVAVSLGFPPRARAGVAAGLAVACLAFNAASASAADSVRSQEWWLTKLHVTKAWQSTRGQGRHRRRPRHRGRPDPGRSRRRGDHGPRLHQFRARARRAVLGCPRHRHGQPHRRPRPRPGPCRRDHRRRAGRHHPVGAGDAGKRRPAAVGRQRRGRASRAPSPAGSGTRSSTTPPSSTCRWTRSPLRERPARAAAPPSGRRSPTRWPTMSCWSRPPGTTAPAPTR